MNKEFCSLSDESCCDQNCTCATQPLSKMIYVVGHNLAEYSEMKWELIGIFNTEEEAISACHSENFWIHKMYMGFCGDEEEPSYMYPKIKQEWKYWGDE